MADWSSGWREATLRAAGIEPDRFTLDVISGWQRSTPTEPWTNNPLGMPARAFLVPTALHTLYAAFPTMDAFRQGFAGFLVSRDGKAVLEALTTGESMTVAWRAIHALSWPAVATEQDWPGALLDHVESTYTDTVTGDGSASRKTAGAVNESPDGLEAIRRQSAALHETATTFKDGAQAVRALIRRLN